MYWEFCVAHKCRCWLPLINICNYPMYSYCYPMFFFHLWGLQTANSLIHHQHVGGPCMEIGAPGKQNGETQTISLVYTLQVSVVVAGQKHDVDIHIPNIPSSLFLWRKKSTII